MGAFIGHLGGALMVLFVALLALRCAKRLGLVFWPAAPARPLAPRWAPGPGALALAALGVLAAQFLFAFFCWRALGQTGGLAAFWQHFLERFTTAGDSPTICCWPARAMRRRVTRRSTSSFIPFTHWLCG